MNKRVKYNRCPLVEVIFQLRFPTILSINSKQPADFQEKIRKEYPFFDEGIEEQNELLINTNGNSAQVKSSQNKNYSFVSVDETYKVNLTSTFIAISTRKYTQWEEFSEKVRRVVKAFQETYEVPFYTRVGLRYIDVIQRSVLGLSNEKWSDLVKPHVLGVVTQFEDSMNSYVSQAEFKDSTDDICTKTHFEFVNVNNSDENSLLIDCDYFKTEKVNVESMMDVATVLHSHSSNFLMTAITEKLNDAMEPEELV